MPPTSQSGTLYFVPNGRFSRNSSLFWLGRCGARRGAALTVRCKRWLWPGSVAHALHGQSHVTQQATQGIGSYFRKATQGLENLPESSFFLLQRFCFSQFLLQLQRHTAVQLEQYAAVEQHQQQAYECGSSRVLLECRWILLLLLLLLLLSARVPVIAWPRHACVCLVLVALEQSSDRGPVSVLFCGAIGNAWKPTHSCSCARVLLELYAAQDNNSNNTRMSAPRSECCSSECC